MAQPDNRDETIRLLRDRLSLLSSASLRINQSLELNDVLEGVLDSARSITGAAYAVITTLDDERQLEAYLVAGLSDEHTDALWELPEGPLFFEYLSSISKPMRTTDLSAHFVENGLPEFRPPTPITSCLVVPVQHRGSIVGTLHVADDERRKEFSQEDEDALVMFASQAALVIENARRHRDERRARADLETLINTSPIGVIVLDVATGQPFSFNVEAARIVDDLRDPGQATADLLKVMTIQRADGSEFSLEDVSLTDLLGSSETVRAEEITMRVPNGTSITALVNATPIHSDDGEVESVVVVMQDLASVEEVERLRAEFLGMVSHELRAPLTSIKGSAMTMLELASDLDPAEMRQYLRIIADQTDNMRDLISELLDVARIETGTLPVDPEPAELSVLVDQARNNFVNSGGRNRLEIDLAPDLPLVMADKRRIGQVIGNLLTNAARHSRQTSLIGVTAELKGLHVHLSVTDEGRGIPAERLPHLFRKFSSNVSEDQASDTGLGLAICKGIVEAHGGRIWAESDGPGLGARFTFTLPAVEQTATDGEMNSAQLRGKPGADMPILVVDDDPQLLRYVRRTLSNVGYRPTVTADPDEVLPLLAEERPQLVILDFMLPGVDGIDLMQDIHREIDVPVIFLSAYGRDQVVARAFENGAHDYIVKPFSPTELVARIEAALRRRLESNRSIALEPFVLGDLRIDYAGRLVTIADEPVKLTATEYQLLYELSINAGRVLTHDHILRRVWGSRGGGDLRTLRTHLRRLRLKLGEDAGDPKYFFSEPRVGYRMAKGEGAENPLSSRGGGPE